MKKVTVLLGLGLLLATVGGYVVLGQNPPPLVQPSAFACYPSGIRPDYIVSQDLNRDGWDDLSVACYGSSQVWQYNNLGSGVFAIPQDGAVVGVPAGPIALIAGQLAPGWNQQVGVLSRFAPVVSTIPFGIPGYPFNALVSPQHMAAGYLGQRDILLDPVIVDSGNGVAPTMQYCVDGAWAPGIALPAGTKPSFVVVADFNNDKWDDVAVCDSNPAHRAIYVYMNGVGALPAGPTWSIPVGNFDPVTMDTADFDGDGFIDIVVVGNDEANEGWARMFLNTVTPSGFAPLAAPVKTWGLGASFVEAFDADGYGRPDFVVANYASQTLTVFLTETLAAATPVSIATRPNICLANHRKEAIKIGSVFKYSLDCGYYPTSIASGDFDRNGKMDIAVTLESAGPVIDPEECSCIEIIFDVSCGFQGSDGFTQISHQEVVDRARAAGANLLPEETSCNCAGCGNTNTPPKPEIQTGSDSKN